MESIQIAKDSGFTGKPDNEDIMFVRSKLGLPDREFSQEEFEQENNEGDDDSNGVQEELELAE